MLRVLVVFTGVMLVSPGLASSHQLRLHQCMEDQAGLPPAVRAETCLCYVERTAGPLMRLWRIVSSSEGWALTQRAYVNACLVKANVMLSPYSAPSDAETYLLP
jgi:hypothetical protein